MGTSSKKKRRGGESSHAKTRAAATLLGQIGDFAALQRELEGALRIPTLVSDYSTGAVPPLAPVRPVAPKGSAGINGTAEGWFGLGEHIYRRMGGK